MLAKKKNIWPEAWRSLAEAAERLALDLLACLASQAGRNPLHAASSSGSSEVVDRLIAARAMVYAADKVLPRTRPQRPPVLPFQLGCQITPALAHVTPMSAE
jgi:hypothetical protein